MKYSHTILFYKHHITTRITTSCLKAYCTALYTDKCIMDSYIILAHALAMVIIHIMPHPGAENCIYSSFLLSDMGRTLEGTQKIPNHAFKQSSVFSVTDTPLMKHPRGSDNTALRVQYI